MSKQTERLLWVTNHPKSIQGLWPRRVGCTYIEGEPKKTDVYTSEDLKKQNIIGVYVDMKPDDYYSLPVVRTPKELKEYEKDIPKSCSPNRSVSRN